ncbi:GNAT family N-acetyltransferase [Nocardioides sp.]|uniref:GNAT family N-acetyltransferase n=1 Tax=Nocardioides sp. TaxID=35761 RepID=UPI001A258B76|nr:GNAT family N-acetyltransferase [Nocardioides sp.]MBJ7357771.1 GNAT family N-acetyltransferase [Nocardioides sp.]
MSAVTIRPYEPRDRPALLALFAGAAEGSPSASLWGHTPSEADIYLLPYADSAAATLLLADDGGRLVGYLAGCADPSTFPSEEERLAAAVRRYRLLLRPRAVAFFARATWDVLRARLRRQPTARDLADARWPAHLHLNVLPEHRGQGVAADLVRAWLDQLRRAGSPGCYLQTIAENPRARAFFAKMGFVEHGPATPLVPGSRWQGRPTHQVTMVQSLMDRPAGTT